ncbi:protein FAM13A [Caerostris extrusa]|uniref:Protein FAM13A n=1 Tax=Caerostris extrusa TaxID=172846 RepID=A0AAV4SFG6_CAEEX|nr:protein FAM13A [Caerostris extrusa]
MFMSHSSVTPKISNIPLSIQEKDSFTSAKENSNTMNNISPQEDHSNGAIGVRMNLEQLTLEKSEELLKDTHKIYPRGRRRHIRHPKHRSYEERRSQSELRTNSHYENEDEFNGNSSNTHSLYDKTDVQHNSTGSLGKL